MLKLRSIAVALSAALVAGPALADGPMSWTGYYVGANIGGGWTDAAGVSYSGLNSASQASINGCAVVGLCHPSLGIDNGSGVVGGLQAGYNWRFSNLVAGLEADFQGSTVNAGRRVDTTVTGQAVNQQETYNANLEWFGTLRGRLGMLVSQTMLAYVTGGFAYGAVERSFDFNQNVVATGALFQNTNGNSVHISTGWTAGGGIEWALTNKMTLSGEYLYVALDGAKLATSRFTGACTAGSCAFATNNSEFDTHIGRLKLNFKF